MGLRRMKGFSRLTGIDEGLRLVMSHSGESIGSERVPVKEAWGRVLDEDVTSTVDVPPFDRSAVDGYAVRSEETYGSSRSNPAAFTVVGTVEAGGSWEGGGSKPRRKGAAEGREAFRIYTGAPIPPGFDSVVMAEDTDLIGSTLYVCRPVPKLANISLRGEDIRTGEAVLERGTLLRPWHVGVLASIGRRDVAVRRRPTVGVFSTGSELLDVDVGAGVSAGAAVGADADRGVAAPAGAGKGERLIDSTRPMVSGLVRELGCAVVDGGIVADDLYEIASKILQLRGQADAVITIGGTSIGGRDLVPEALGSAGPPGIIFHGIAAKPGKPAGFAVSGGKPVFLLPGYPVSALIGFENLVQPLLCRWLGIEPPRRERVRAVMSRRVPTAPGVRHFLRVTLERMDGGLSAMPIALTGSGLLSSITKADGVVIIREDLEGVEEGEEVEVELLGGKRFG